jgi:hypothetical protein
MSLDGSRIVTDFFDVNFIARFLLAESSSIVIEEGI